MAIDFTQYLSPGPSLGAYNVDFSSTFGSLPGQPGGTTPTTEMRALYLSMLQAQNQASLLQQQAEQARLNGDFTRALSIQQQADAMEVRRKELEQAAFKQQQDVALRQQELGQQQSQFLQALQEEARQFGETQGLRAGELTGMYQGQQTLGGRAADLANRQQQFVEEQYLTNLASNPTNLIASSIAQGNRQSGGFFATGDPATGGVFDAAVPVASDVVGLLQRDRIAPTGTHSGRGFMTTLGDLQNSNDLRLRPGGTDLASLRSVTSNPTSAGFLESTLKAQGQTPTDFFSAATAAMPRRRNTFQMGVF